MGELENIINSTEERARAEGSYDKAVSIALNMLSAGMSIEQIAQLTGLEINEVEKLNL